jgi:hypothetical protein
MEQEDSHKSNLVLLLQVQQMLLPLLLKEEYIWTQEQRGSPGKGQEEIKGKCKRGLYKGTEARQAARRQRQLDVPQEVLDSPSPEGRMRILRELHMLQSKEA